MVIYQPETGDTSIILLWRDRPCDISSQSNVAAGCLQDVLLL